MRQPALCSVPASRLGLLRQPLVLGDGGVAALDAEDVTLAVHAVEAQLNAAAHGAPAALHVIGEGVLRHRLRDGLHANARRNGLCSEAVVSALHDPVPLCRGGRQSFD